MRTAAAMRLRLTQAERRPGVGAPRRVRAVEMQPDLPSPRDGHSGQGGSAPPKRGEHDELHRFRRGLPPSCSSMRPEFDGRSRDVPDGRGQGVAASLSSSLEKKLPQPVLA